MLAYDKECHKNSQYVYSKISTCCLHYVRFCFVLTKEPITFFLFSLFVFQTRQYKKFLYMTLYIVRQKYHPCLYVHVKG